MGSDTDSLIEAVQTALDGALPGEDAQAAIAAVRRWEEENGYRCVPTRAEDDMCEAAWNSDAVDQIGEHRRFHSAHMVWDAMVAASPTPPGAVNQKGDAA